MTQADNKTKLDVNSIFKSNRDFELSIRRHCQSKGKSAIQLMNGRGIIHLICALQMKEIRRVRKHNKGKPKADQIKPEIKRHASFKAVRK